MRRGGAASRDGRINGWPFSGGGVSSLYVSLLALLRRDAPLVSAVRLGAGKWLCIAHTGNAPALTELWLISYVCRPNSCITCKYIGGLAQPADVLSKAVYAQLACRDIQHSDYCIASCIRSNHHLLGLQRGSGSRKAHIGIKK